MNQIAMDRWATVKHIHQCALDRDPSERAAFVDESCGGDETLRREVQSLLRYATEAESFLERPAVDVAPTGPSAPGETALVGRTVSHYQVLSLLGAGGMGEVYLARDPRLDRTVALKILPGDLAVDPDRMLRFAREAKAASALNHPNVATIYDVGESDGIHFIVMEHVEGETIAARIGRPLTPSEVVDVAVQAADALDVAHAKGITHRDIKPANLMLTLRGHVKVLDFGVAKMARGDEASPNDDWNVEPLTAVGGVVGSGPYMSPEQIAGGDVDPRSDVFSLGVVIYQMATRQLPFSGEDTGGADAVHPACDPGAHHTAQSRDPIGAGTDYVQVPRQECRRPLSIGARAVERPVAAEASGGCEGKARDAGFSARRCADHRFVPCVGSIRARCPRLGASALGVFLRGIRRCVGVFGRDGDRSNLRRRIRWSGACEAWRRRPIANVLVEAFGEAKAAALRALALDDESADAQVALGQVMFTAEWDWIAAERSFQRALAINPNHAEAYIYYGT